MTDPELERPPTPTVDASHDQHDDPPPFAPIFTLVNNTSTRTTHHPHVRYIFSDDDPDILTQALAELDPRDDSTSDAAFPHNPNTNNRAMILDLAPDHRGGYSVAWASSLSSSWAVLDAQLSQISPPSSDGGSNNGNEGGDNSARADRLMLRIDGVESSASGLESDLAGETSRQGSGLTSGGGSGQHDRDREENRDKDHSNLVEKFERQMTTLRKIVDASEDRRRQTAPNAYATAEITPPPPVEERTPAD